MQQQTSSAWAWQQGPSLEHILTKNMDAVYQDTKARPIDDGKPAGHNEAATMQETISCTAAEILPIMARALLQKRATMKTANPMAASQLAFGTEDMWKGFRYLCSS